jgi:hypothetical protein
MADSPPAPPRMTDKRYTTQGYGLWKTLAINTVIAIGITLFSFDSFWNNLVYSHCIGLMHRSIH